MTLQLELRGLLLDGQRGGFFPLSLLTQDIGEIVGLVFGPSEPESLDIDFVEHGSGLRGVESGNMIPVLMRDREYIQFAAGRLLYVGGDFRHDRAGLARAEHNPAVDHEMDELIVVAGKAE